MFVGHGVAAVLDDDGLAMKTLDVGRASARTPALAAGASFSVMDVRESK